MNDPADEVPRHLRGWLTDVLIPRWIERVVETSPVGYIERFAADGGIDAGTRRSTLVTARLVYAFSHAHCLSASPRSLDAARRGVDALLGPLRRPEGGFRHAVALDGSVLDERADLYDLAFVLFGLAWHHRATGETAARTVAEKTAAFIQARLASPNGGFHEDTRGALPRRQNPHMHLLEAFHAWGEVTDDPRWLARASAVVVLLRERFLDRANGSLGEFFEADWAPAAGAVGALREPGHHFEWVWLLHHHARLTGDRTVVAEADRLYRFGLEHGLARMPDGLPVVIDAVDREGRVVAGSRLLWPQTEALKAFCARVEFLGDPDAAERIEAMLVLIFRHYVDAGTGLWRNQLSAEGLPLAVELPVRVLYHLVLALAEAARVRRPGAGRPPVRPPLAG